MRWLSFSGFFIGSLTDTYITLGLYCFLKACGRSNETYRLFRVRLLAVKVHRWFFFVLTPQWGWTKLKLTSFIRMNIMLFFFLWSEAKKYTHFFGTFVLYLRCFLFCYSVCWKKVEDIFLNIFSAGWMKMNGMQYWWENGSHEWINLTSHLSVTIPNKKKTI